MAQRMDLSGGSGTTGKDPNLDFVGAAAPTTAAVINPVLSHDDILIALGHITADRLRELRYQMRQQAASPKEERAWAERYIDDAKTLPAEVVTALSGIDPAEERAANMSPAEQKIWARRVIDASRQELPRDVMQIMRAAAERDTRGSGSTLAFLKREERLDWMLGFIAERCAIPATVIANVKSIHARLARGETLSMEETLGLLGVAPGHIRAATERKKQDPTESIQDIVQDWGLLNNEGAARTLALLNQHKYFGPGDVAQIHVASILQWMAAEKMDLGDSCEGFVPIGLRKSAEGNSVYPVFAISDLRDKTTINNRFRNLPGIDFQFASKNTIEAVFRRHFTDSRGLFLDHVAKLEAMLPQVGRGVVAAPAADTPGPSPEEIDILMAGMIRHACYVGASDIQIYPSRLKGMIRLKVDGSGRILTTLSRALYSRLMQRIVSDANVRTEDVDKEPKDVMFDLGKLGEAGAPGVQDTLRDIRDRYTFRMVLMPGSRGHTATLRVLDGRNEVADFAALGFNTETQAVLRRSIESPHGLIVVTGPTGSGKTTTLNSVLRLRDPIASSIQSIENPTEYIHGQWLQYQLNVKNTTDEGVLWSTFMKGLLRNAPDVILLGEVRDEKTARTMVAAANTGHLVATTVHANSAVEAISRLATLGVDHAEMADILLCVLSQRLVRKLCMRCREVDDRDSTIHLVERGKFDKVLRDFKPYKAHALGCDECGHTGYRGRAMIYEVLDAASSDVNKLIERRATSRELRDTMPKGTLLVDCAVNLLAAGLTSAEEVRQATRIQ